RSLRHGPRARWLKPRGAEPGSPWYHRWHGAMTSRGGRRSMRRWLRWSYVVLAALASATPAAAAAPTYHPEGVRDLQKPGQDCARPGQVAPFSLLTDGQGRKRGSDLATVTEKRTMPPWHASTTVGGPFRDARVLSDSEIETLASWAEAGCLEGNPSD